MRAVAPAVLDVLGVGEVLGGDDPAVEVGVSGVVAGVEDGDGDAVSGVACVPGLAGADEVPALVEGGAHPPVQQDPGVVLGAEHAGTVTAFEVLPEGGQVLVGDFQAA